MAAAVRHDNFNLSYVRQRLREVAEQLKRTREVYRCTAVVEITPIFWVLCNEPTCGERDSTGALRCPRHWIEERKVLWYQQRRLKREVKKWEKK